MSIINYVANQLRKPTGFFGTQIIGRMMNVGNHGLHIFILELLELESEEQVLEIGFGGGRLLREIAKSLVQGRVTGVDFSIDMVNRATKKNKSLINDGRLEVRNANIEALPYPDNHFDKICTANTLYFWPQPADNIKELYRILKPGGLLLVGFHTREQMEKDPAIQPEVFTMYTVDEVQTLLESGGFSKFSVQSKKKKVPTATLR